MPETTYRVLLNIKDYSGLRIQRIIASFKSEDLAIKFADKYWQAIREVNVLSLSIEECRTVLRLNNIEVGAN